MRALRAIASLSASCASLAVLLAFPFQAQDVPRPARIAGVVQNQKGEPLSGIKIATARSGITTTSGADGAFILNNLAPGRTVVSYSAEGYVPRQLAYLLEPGKEIRTVAKLSSTGVITGRLFDPSGRPIPNIAVVPVRRILATDGYPELVTYPAARTNDRGEFRIFELPPGSYWLNISSPLPGVAQAASPAETPEPGLLSPFLYPDAIQLSDATVVEVKAGEELQLKDMAALPGRRLGSIRVEVSNPGAEVKEFSFGFGLASRQLSTTESRIPNPQTVTDDDRRPKIFRLEPGTTLVKTFWPNQVGLYEAFAMSSRTQAEIAGSQIAFTGTELVVQLVLADRDSRITFQTKLADTDSETPVDGVRLNLITQGVSFMGTRRDSLSGITDTSGSLTIPLRSGRYELYRAAGLPEDVYIDAVEQSGRDGLITGLIAGPASSPSSLSSVVHLQLRKGAASLRGHVRSEGGIAVHDALVTLVPTPPRDTSKLINLRPAVRTLQDGAFEFRGVAPGRYSIYAWSHDEYPSYLSDTGNYLNTEFLGRFLQRAIAIDLKERSNDTVEIVIPPPTN